MEKVNFKELKEGDIIYKFCFSRMGGRVWEIIDSAKKVVKVNAKSIRFSDVNNEQRKFTQTFEQLDDKVFFYNREDIIEHAKPFFERFAKQAEEYLKEYTKEHKDYAYYEYSANIIKDINELFQNGYTIEKYYDIKKKYHVFEEKTIVEMFLWS